MSLRCQDCQDQLLANALDVTVAPAAVEAHMRECDLCARYAQSVALQRRAFGEIARMRAPEALDGRVVAACHAGHRQERAVALVANLVRWNVPAELDRKVLDAQDGQSLVPLTTAPDVLDRLVSEDLRDPSKAIARRFTGRLARLKAPAELGGRVARALSAGGIRSGPRSRWLLPTAAVALFLALGASALLMRHPSTPHYSFEVRRGAQAATDPLIRSLLNGVTGGALDASQSIRAAQSTEAPQETHASQDTHGGAR